MDNVRELEEYARNILEIPYVCFEGMDASVCKVIVNTIREFFQKYPFLRYTLSGLGNSDYLTNYLNLNWYADVFYVEEELVCQHLLNQEHSLFTVNMTVIFDEKTRDYSKFVVLSICDAFCFSDLKSIEQKIQSIDFIFERNLKEVIYHELGHLLDFVLQISSSSTFLDFYFDHINDFRLFVSEYAVYNEQEGLAEVFSKYHNRDCQDEIVIKTMNLLRKYYEVYFYQKKKAQNLNLTRKYKF